MIPKDKSNNGKETILKLPLIMLGTSLFIEGLIFILFLILYTLSEKDSLEFKELKSQIIIIESVLLFTIVITLYYLIKVLKLKDK